MSTSPALRSIALVCRLCGIPHNRHYVDGWVMWPAGVFPVVGVSWGPSSGHIIRGLSADVVEPFEEILVGRPVRQGLGGERLVGAFDGFAFGLRVGAGVDLGG